MLNLHIANKNYSSWSLRPWVLMRALGIPFQEQLPPRRCSNGVPQVWQKSGGMKHMTRKSGNQERF